jgi:hypothetical protein
MYFLNCFALLYSQPMVIFIKTKMKVHNILAFSLDDDTQMNSELGYFCYKGKFRN